MDMYTVVSPLLSTNANLLSSSISPRSHILCPDPSLRPFCPLLSPLPSLSHAHPPVSHPFLIRTVVGPRWSCEDRPAASGDTMTWQLASTEPSLSSNIYALFNTNLVNLYLLSPFAGNNRVLLSSSRWLTPSPSFKNTSA